VALRPHLSMGLPFSVPCLSFGEPSRFMPHNAPVLLLWYGLFETLFRTLSRCPTAADAVDTQWVAMGREDLKGLESPPASSGASAN
jgi:hypothetical protein